MRELAFGAVFAVFISIALLAVAAWPIPGQPVASFFPAGITPAQAAGVVGSAGGRLLQVGSDAVVVISIGEAPSYAADLYRSGAWLVVSATVVKLCVTLTDAS